MAVFLQLADVSTLLWNAGISDRGDACVALYRLAWVSES